VKEMRVSRGRIFLSVLIADLLVAPFVFAQPQFKKIRMGISTTSIAFLSIYAAQLKGFYRDEGIDLELILMPATLASSAVLTGDIDYNGAVTGVIAAAVQGRPMKVLIFTADRSLQSIISRKEIKEPKDLKGKRSPAALLAPPQLSSPDSRQSISVSIPIATSAY
jgi:ABC-type nitrate/sulfonate/bicarbonate transport system substrate-binding protein